MVIFHSYVNIYQRVVCIIYWKPSRMACATYLSTFHRKKTGTPTVCLLFLLILLVLGCQSQCQRESIKKHSPERNKPLTNSPTSFTLFSSFFPHKHHVSPTFPHFWNINIGSLTFLHFRMVQNASKWVVSMSCFTNIWSILNQPMDPHGIPAQLTSSFLEPELAKAPRSCFHWEPREGLGVCQAWKMMDFVNGKDDIPYPYATHGAGRWTPTFTPKIAQM